MTLTKSEKILALLNQWDLAGEYKKSGDWRAYNFEAETIAQKVRSNSKAATVVNLANSIVFIDEENHFIRQKEFAEVVQTSSNYFVLITRESLPNLPYSIQEIYGIRTSES